MKSYINKHFSFFKNFLINFAIFCFVSIVFVNQIHLQVNEFEKIENNNFYAKVENFDLKANYFKRANILRLLYGP